MDTLINIGIILTYFMIGFAGAAAIGFGIKRLVENKKNIKKTLYTIGGLIILLIFSYIIASDEIIGSYEKYNITASTAKRVGMGLITFYLLSIGAVGTILYTEITKSLSK